MHDGNKVSNSEVISSGRLDNETECAQDRWSVSSQVFISIQAKCVCVCVRVWTHCQLHTLGKTSSFLLCACLSHLSLYQRQCLPSLLHQPLHTFRIFYFPVGPKGIAHPPQRVGPATQKHTSAPFQSIYRERKISNKRHEGKT